MVTAPVLEEVAIVRQAPESFRYYQESRATRYLLLNEPDKKSYKSADFVLFQSVLLSISVELDKIERLYNKYSELFDVDYKTFFDSYLRMCDAMNAIVPDGCKIITEVSAEEECLYNYYEFDDKKIFFNLFFEGDEKEPAVRINVRSNDKFLSIDGSIDNAADYLRNALKRNLNV